jgi:hypothetical protein
MLLAVAVAFPCTDILLGTYISPHSGALLMVGCFAYLANSFTSLALPRYEAIVYRWMSPLQAVELLFHVLAAGHGREAKVTGKCGLCVCYQLDPAFCAFQFRSEKHGIPIAMVSRIHAHSFRGASYRGSKNQANPLKRRGRLAGVFHTLSRAAGPFWH